MPSIHEIMNEVWSNCERLYGWNVGRYVVMPDDVHFFCTPKRDERRLDVFVGKWKEWVAKYIHRRLGLEGRIWQPEFFDHVLRSSESYEEKWEYVFHNPVRAGLIHAADKWPYQGERHPIHIE